MPRERGRFWPVEVEGVAPKVGSESEGDQRLELRLVWRGRLNTEIRRAAARLDAAEPALDWKFRCECGAPDCEAMVAVTLAEFDALQLTEAPVLAEGHGVRRAEIARRKSQQLRDDASALREQAKHQQQRALRRRP
jgi:hypothetical protein